MKRVYGIAMILIMFVCCLVGCSHKDEPSVASTGLSSSSSELNFDLYQGQHMPLSYKYDLVEVMDDTTILGCYVDASIPTIVFQDKSTGSIIKQVPLPISSENSYIQNISSDNRGNAYVMAKDYDESNTYTWVIDTDGKLNELSEYILEETDTARFLAVQGLKADSKGNIYLWCEMAVPVKEALEDTTGMSEDGFVMVDRIYVKNADLVTSFYVQVVTFGDTELKGFSMGRDGNPIAVIAESEGIFIHEIDMENKQLKEEGVCISNSGTESGNSIETVVVSEKGVLFSRDGVLYEYNYTENTTEAIFYWSSYGINQSEILYLGEHDSIIEVIDNNSLSSLSELTTLTKGENKKTVISLGVVQLSQDIEKMVTEFNRYSKDVQIDIITYFNSNESFEQSVEKLKLDIITGKAPDLIEVSMIDYATFAEKGVLTDLLELMRNDNEFNQDMLLDSVVNSYQINNHLYNIAPSFQIFTMWGKTDNIGNKVGISLNELAKIIESNGKKIDSISGFSADEPALTTLCTFGMNEFINWEAGTCNFTEEYFREVLTFCKEYTGGYTGGSTSQGIKQGDILISVGIISSVADYQLQLELYGDNLTFIGYPTENGNGSAMGFRGSQISINEASKEKDAAWQFVKYYMINGYNGEGFPIMQEEFSEAMVKAKESNVVQDAEGTYEMPKGTYTDVDTYIEVFGASQADVDNIEKLILNINTCFKYNTDILSIINEEAESYFSEQKSMSEVVDLIQSRVQIYLAEQLG